MSEISNHNILKQASNPSPELPTYQKNNLAILLACSSEIHIQADKAILKPNTESYPLKTSWNSIVNDDYGKIPDNVRHMADEFNLGKGVCLVFDKNKNKGEFMFVEQYKKDCQNKKETPLVQAVLKCQKDIRNGRSPNPIEMYKQNLGRD